MDGSLTGAPNETASCFFLEETRLFCDTRRTVAPETTSAVCVLRPTKYGTDATLGDRVQVTARVRHANHSDEHAALHTLP